MSQREPHCPFLNRSDPRCATHFSLGTMGHAFEYCLDEWAHRSCPHYATLRAEEREARGRVPCRASPRRAARPGLAILAATAAAAAATAAREGPDDAGCTGCRKGHEDDDGAATPGRRGPTTVELFVRRKVLQGAIAAGHAQPVAAAEAVPGLPGL